MISFFKYKRHKYAKQWIKPIYIILLVLLPSASFGVWNLGCDIGYFSKMGNIGLRNSLLEYEVFLNYENHKGGIYWLSATYQKPELETSSKIDRLDITGIWFMRSAAFKIFKRRIQINAGPGISIIDRKNNTGRTIFGSFSFRSDVLISIWRKYGITTSMGVSYRGCPLHSTGLITDRFGMVVVISG